VQKAQKGSWGERTPFPCSEPWKWGGGGGGVWQRVTDTRGAAALVIDSPGNGLPRLQSSLLIVFLALLIGSTRRHFLAALVAFGAPKRRADSATCGKWSLDFSDRKKDTIYFKHAHINILHSRKRH
jgi:hypothetical protein